MSEVKTDMGWPKSWADSGPDFTPSKAAQRRYGRQLAALAARIGSIAAEDPHRAEEALHRYAETIDPWARQAAAAMVQGARKKNDQAWRSLAGRMGLDVRAMLASEGVGAAVSERVAENARLIRSMVTGAADQVGEMIRENMAAGSRAEDLAQRIERVGEVNRSRAMTIARTETAKAGTALTMARARSIGSTGYVWRTARDGDTRESHRAMEGKFVEWDSPPTIDRMTGHAGEFPNCRCYPEPVVPKETGGVHAPALPDREAELATGSMAALSQWERQVTSQVIPHVPDSPLLNVDKAVYNRLKLSKYSMDPNAASPAGRDKAARWKQLLNADPSHAEMVERQVQALVPHLPAVRKEADGYGERFNVIVPVTGPNGVTVDVIAAWIYDRDKNDGRRISTVPRLTNCFIPKRKKQKGPK